MDQLRIEYLLKQFSKGELSTEEQEELDQLLTGSQREQFEEQVARLIAEQEANAAIYKGKMQDDASFAKIMAADKPAKVINVSFFTRHRKWIGAAAVLFVCSLTGAYFMLRHQPLQHHSAGVSQQLPEKEPGRNTAILTLDDNSTVELASNGDRIIGTQGQSQVAITNGKLTYHQQNDNTAAIAYNRITTPRGGEFNITLSDGTKLWLNAASMIRFPTTFTGAKREVELEGEAFFEVAEDKQHPFEVKIRNKTIQVLGTQFNVMGYDDELVTITTLVKGSVRILSPGQPARTLVPGQHAVINNQTSDILVEDADIDEETAWKNGRTYFNGADIKQIMRQVSRWYNVDVQYVGEVNKLRFTCTVSRTDKLSKLLQLLEMTGTVRFTMEGNTIIVHY